MGKQIVPAVLANPIKGATKLGANSVTKAQRIYNVAAVSNSIVLTVSRWYKLSTPYQISIARKLNWCSFSVHQEKLQHEDSSFCTVEHLAASISSGSLTTWHQMNLSPLAAQFICVYQTGPLEHRTTPLHQFQEKFTFDTSISYL